MDANDVVDISEAIATHLPPPFGTLITSQFKLIDALSGQKSETIGQQLKNSTANLENYINTLDKNEDLRQYSSWIQSFADWIARQHAEIVDTADKISKETSDRINSQLSNAFGPNGQNLFAALDGLRHNYFGDPAATGPLMHGITVYILGHKWQLQLDALLNNDAAKQDFETLRIEIEGNRQQDIDGWSDIAIGHVAKIENDRMAKVVDVYRAECDGGEVKGWTWIDQAVSEDTATHMVADKDIGPGAIPHLSPDRMSDNGNEQIAKDARQKYVDDLRGKVQTQYTPYINAASGWRTSFDQLNIATNTRE